jgi:NADH-quinone oxidoreductase subunit L
MKTAYLIACFFPLLGSVLAGVFGTKFAGKGWRFMTRGLSHWLTIVCVFIAALASAWTLADVMASPNNHFEGTLYTWAQVAGLKLEIGFLIDPLTATMMCVVTWVSLMVHIYTIGYMAEEDGYERFFSYISLFTFSMMMLVMSNNLLQLFFGWEAVGLVSYLLIGFYYTRESAIFANMKAFLVNRVGDFGFIIGIGLVLAHTGTMNYGEIFAKVDSFKGVVLAGTDWALITVACIALFIGAMGKSAQFPLHVWLPDSMEGPTPISALIHAATMVTAGIFMVSRMSPLFELSNTALMFVMFVGSITALFMGFMGIIQNDIKRVVAYSTLSQLGYMTVALGASAYSVAMFHVMTHAFFKALLFLAAGSVIMGMHHCQDIRYMGALRKYMPITWVTSLIGSLALIGTPFFSGFYSKDSIIEAVHATQYGWVSSFANIAVLAGVFVTAFYSFRMYFLVFHGKERYDQNPESLHSTAHGHDAVNADHGHHHAATHGHGLGHGHGHDQHAADKPHESPAVVTVPLMLLAIPSVIIGFIAIGPLLFHGYFRESIKVLTDVHPAMNALAAQWHGPVAMVLHGLQSAPFWLALAGVLTAWALYLKWTDIPGKIQSKVMPLYRLLDNKYYLDAFNQAIFAKGALLLGGTFWKVGDQTLIDGVGVNGSWKAVGWVASVLRLFQTGYIYHYAFGMIIGLVAMIYFVARI